jgi:hypothetical protein
MRNELFGGDKKMTRDLLSRPGGELWQTAAPLVNVDSDELQDAARQRGLLLVDLDGVVRFGDEGAVDLFDSPLRELAGRQVSELLPVLSLQAGRQGYNVAFVGFRFPRGQWVRFRDTGETREDFEIGLKVTFFKGIGVTPFFLVQICILDHHEAMAAPASTRTYHCSGN